MSTSFDLDRSSILRVAFQLCGIVMPGQDPDSNQLAMGSDFLNMVLKDMQNKGIMLRKLERTTATLSQGIAQYNTAADTLDIDGGTPYVTDSSGTDMRLTMITRAMYMEISVKSITGSPTQMYVEKASTISFFLYPVPDSTWVSITYPRVILLDDLATGGTTTGLQSKYLRAITLGVAHMIAYASGLLQKAMALKADFDQVFDDAANDDTERGDIVFKPRYGIRMSRS